MLKQALINFRFYFITFEMGHIRKTETMLKCEYNVFHTQLLWSLINIFILPMNKHMSDTHQLFYNYLSQFGK